MEYEMKPLPESLDDMEIIDDLRYSEISGMFAPHFTALDNYRCLLINLSIILGQKAPDDARDKTIRNFLADTYDLIEGVIPSLKRGRHNVAAPLIRRLYENVSLVNAFCLNEEIHHRWMQGEEIPNWEVRKELDKSVLGAEIDSTKYVYYSLSDMAHPSRIAISDRFLGEGNSFTLGGYTTPSVSLIAELLVRTLSLVFWFGALLSLFFKPVWTNSSPDFIELYKQTSLNTLKINAQLFEELDRLRQEENFTKIQRVKKQNRKRNKARD